MFCFLFCVFFLEFLLRRVCGLRTFSLLPPPTTDSVCVGLLAAGVVFSGLLAGVVFDGCGFGAGVGFADCDGIWFVGGAGFATGAGVGFADAGLLAGDFFEFLVN